MKNNGNKPAFPVLHSIDNNWVDEPIEEYKGITKREYFAAMAMNGLLYHSISPMSEEAYAKKAVALSDELLKQLEDGNNKS